VLPGLTVISVYLFYTEFGSRVNWITGWFFEGSQQIKSNPSGG
jgi:hypothetical protein